GSVASCRDGLQAGVETDTHALGTVTVVPESHRHAHFKGPREHLGPWIHGTKTTPHRRGVDLDRRPRRQRGLEHSLDTPERAAAEAKLRRLEAPDQIHMPHYLRGERFDQARELIEILAAQRFPAAILGGGALGGGHVQIDPGITDAVYAAH